MALSNWDPVMLTIYLNEVYREEPKQTPVSEVRRRSVVDTIVIDLRQRSNQQHEGRNGGDSENRSPKPVDVYPMKDETREP